MKTPTRRKPAKSKPKGARKPRRMFIDDNWCDLAGRDAAKLFTKHTFWRRPVLVLDLSEEAVGELVERVAKAIDPLAFVRYKAGDCLPRGHECDTPERVNEIQEWRERTARSNARKALAAIGITSKSQ